jgi:RimJ/RimL family protein N-acetyltransferase
MASPEDALTLRPGRAADWEAVWRWRRDPLTRAMSRRTQELSPEVVRAEVEAAVDAEDKRLLIAEQDGAPCGVVRFDRLADGRWEASLNLAPEARGRSLGRPMLERAIAQAFPARAPALTAQIKPQNAASRRLFEDLGFVPAGERGGLLLYERPEADR